MTANSTTTWKGSERKPRAERPAPAWAKDWETDEERAERQRRVAEMERWMSGDPEDED